MLLFWLLGPCSSDPLGAATIRGSAQWQTSLVQVPQSDPKGLQNGAWVQFVATFLAKRQMCIRLHIYYVLDTF